MSGVVLPNFTSVPADFPWLYNFEFEKNYDHVANIGWFQKYWTSAFIFSAIYLVLVFGGQRLMRNRGRFELYWPLLIWSSLLAIYSWWATVKSWGEFIHVLRNYGWYATACDPIGCIGIPGFWAWTFTISKLFEFGDTAFIVLRKQKLIFLHWYHHITVFLYAWYGAGQCPAPGRYFGLINVNVHALMYTYYAAKASKMFRIPKAVNIFITSFQTTQMVAGICVNAYVLRALNAGEECHATYKFIYVSFLMYLSYFILFSNFFYKTYFVGKKSKDVSPMQNRISNHENNNGVIVNDEIKKEL